MAKSVEIRRSSADDWASIEALYPDAFPEEDLLPLVRDLLQAQPIVLSLIAWAGSSLAGHVIFTRCGTAESSESVALLGPLAVAPAFQRQGVGSALVRQGFEEQERAGVTRVCVLGDPAYYSRFGFAPESALKPPYPLPDKWQGAWQSMGLADAGPPSQGKLIVPQPWRQQALWSA